MRVLACPAISLWLLSTGAVMGQAQPTSTLIESTSYSPSTWQQLVLTEALAMHATHREEAQRLQNLQGVDSDHYLLRRIPVPSAARELRGLRHVAPLMIELFLKGVETYRWSSPATAQPERAALQRDLLVAIGRSDHPASVHFLTDVIREGCDCCESCNAAVGALGDTGAVQALPVLREVLDEARRAADVEAYLAAVAALGRIRHPEAWPHIAAELGNADPRVREAAIRSAAAYGSRWYWSTDPVQGARVRATVGLSLLDVLSETEDEGIVLAVLESLGGVATPRLREAVERRRADSSYAVRSAEPGASRTVGGDRLRRALNRIDRSLARQQGGRDGTRPCS